MIPTVYGKSNEQPGRLCSKFGKENSVLDYLFW